MVRALGHAERHPGVWIERGRVDAMKDNGDIWRIADDQQLQPSAYRLRGPEEPKDPGEDGPRELRGHSEGTGDTAPHDGPRVSLADHLSLRNALALAERDLAVSCREVELLRETLAKMQGLHHERVGDLRAALAASEAERVRLLDAVLHRPSLLERLVRALRAPLGRDRPPSGIRCDMRSGLPPPSISPPRDTSPKTDRKLSRNGRKFPGCRRWQSSLRAPSTMWRAREVTLERRRKRARW